MKMVIIIIVLILLLGFAYMFATTPPLEPSPAFGIDGSGYWVASTVGLDLPNKARIRMKFSTLSKGNGRQILLQIGSLEPTDRSLAWWIAIDSTKPNEIFLTRLPNDPQDMSGAETADVVTNITLTDTKWHSFDLTINVESNKHVLLIDDEHHEVIDSSNTLKNFHVPEVKIGGFEEGRSFQGYVKDVWFGDVRKLDMTYTPGIMRGVIGGKQV